MEDHKNKKARTMLYGLPVVGGRRTTFPRVTAVSSSRRGLTSLFGMVRGAPPRHSRHWSLSGLLGREESRHKDNHARPPRVSVCLPPHRGD